MRDPVALTDAVRLAGGAIAVVGVALALTAAAFPPGVHGGSPTREETVAVASPDDPAPQLSVEDHELFENRIRPLIEKRCADCHGQDGLGELNLENRAGLLAGGASGPSVVLGDPDRSLLIQAVRHELPKLKMPMTGGRLTGQQIADLEEWVRRGAPWPGSDADASSAESPTFEIAEEDRKFWAYQPLASPEPPAVVDGRWGATAIDKFLQHERLARQVEPVEPAEKRELLRRVTYDVTGLPPTEKELEAFLGDESEESFPKVVDRLLESPHYGEHWARHWMDVIRFGEDDTRGLAEDDSGRERYPQAFRYRDWIVDAVNEDLPWNSFVEAQIAADLMPLPEGKSRSDLLPALGFLGAGPWYYDLAEPLTARADERHDRVDVTTRGFLGLTVGCARCHNHKYDPFPITDYYAIAGVFANTEYHEYPVGSSEEADEFEREKEFRKLLRESLREYRRDEAAQMSRLFTHRVSDYMMGVWKVSGEPKLEIGKVANQDRLDLELLQRFVDFTAKEPKHYPNMKDWQAMIAAGGDDEEQEERAKELAKRFERELLEVLSEVKKLEEHNEYLIANGSKPPRDRKSVPMPNGFESFFDEHQLELETLPREKMLLHRDVYNFDIDKSEYPVKFEPGLLSFWGWTLDRHMSAPSSAHVKALRERLEEMEKPENRLPFVMGVRDREQEQIADLPLHLRGSPHNLGAPVPRHFVSVLTPGVPEPWKEGSGRLALAQAMSSHPLAARVIVNRVWRWHFGTGLVDTPSNFGKMGERPSHPELLEYLASGFVENGQSLKWLHRQILSTQTYRLASTHSADNAAQDPTNRLYWRANRKRLSAEEIRDSLLLVAGNLDTKVGGTSLSLSDPENQRRTMYSFVSRFEPDIYLQTFDFPNPSLTAERRFVTNVPLQNLYFMNSDFVRRQAEALGTRLLKERQKDEKQSVGSLGAAKSVKENPPRELDVVGLPEATKRDLIERAYVLLFARDATEPEIAAGLRFLKEDGDGSSDASGVKADASSSANEAEGELGAAAGAKKTEAESAWVRYLRALFNTNEFRFVA